MTYQYKFVPQSIEEKVPTIQERFIEMFYEQDHTLDFDTRFHITATVFTDEYKLQPPYSNASSFKVTLCNRIKYGDRK